MSVLADMELSSLLLMARANDDLAFAEVVERYAPMLNKLALRFATPTLNAEELYSEACVALYRAVMTYDISRTDVTFGLYARICVYNRLCDLAGRAVPQGAVCEYDVDSLGRSTAIESDLVTRDSLRRALRAARKILSDYEYDVFRLYLRGYTTKEMAAELSKTPKSVDNAKARMMKHLRENSEYFSDF